MCYHPMKINATGRCAPRFAFIPCGKCDECRRLEKSGWSFRLGLELQSKLDEGWHIGFCTLTYKEGKVPTIPKMCFLNPKEYKRIYCFDKYEMMKFIRQLRSVLANKYNITGVVYFVGSEFGKKATKRSHYHMLIAYPPFKRGKGKERSGITDKEVHGEIVRLWHEKGFIYPENYDGTGKGYNKNEERKPFKVDSSIGAYLCAKYACKYACKDIGFEKEIDYSLFVNRDNQGQRILKRNCFGELQYKYGIPDTETAYRVFLRCKSFHLQSRSLGWSYFENMSCLDKLKCIERGVKFLGEEHRQKLPRYIKNKLIFKNKYIIEETKDGEKKRLVRREPNEFFKENIQLIYQCKVNGYKKLFESLRQETYWTTRGSDEWYFKECNIAMNYLLTKYHLTLEDFTRVYISLYKIPYDRAYSEIELYRVWYNRYWKDVVLYDKEDGAVIYHSPCYDYEFLDDVNDVFTYMFFCLGSLSTRDSEMTKKVDAYKRRKRGSCYG